MPKSDLPFGSEFSPSQIRLPEVLEFAHRFGGDWHAFEEAVRLAYFEGHQTTEYNRRKLANNTKLGMIAYGIIDRNANLTDLGKILYEIRHDEESLYDTLARHILLNLHGATLVQCVQDMHASGETIDLLRLRTWLEERGIHFPRGGKHPSIMRLWLEKAGVFISGWRVNSGRFQQLLGVSMADLDTLAGFSPSQRAYLKTLANMGGPGPYLSNEVEKLAHTTYGIRFNEKNLPKEVLYPLELAGYITLKRGTAPGGRGAKPFLVTPTAKLDADIVKPLIAQLEEQVRPELRPFLRRPLPEIITEIDEPDRYRRGLALEALAIRLMRLVDLTYVSTRLRGEATGGAEVDVIFETTRLVFSRWQIQCKNTASVSLDDVAKEVGLTHFLKSNVIVIISTGTIGSEARRYSNKIMSDSNLSIILIDREDIGQIVANPTRIAEILSREAEHAMKIKALVI
ncbi:MAG: hypothetical protein KatS3mg059_0339 [Thermomicrobiales bacterium]|nr:MAG: hypothetical protein KatS3mg059_0339 [Thermomicrobiales bacterium]